MTNSGLPVIDFGEEHPPGLHIARTGYAEFHTRAAHSRTRAWVIDRGTAVYLHDGDTALAVAELIDDRDAQPRLQAAAIAEIAPWAQTIAHLIRSWALADRQDALASLLRARGYVDVYSEGSFEVRREWDLEAWTEKIRRLATDDDPADLTGDDLGAVIQVRLKRERAAAQQAAVAALPPASGGSLPPLTGTWELARGPRLPHAPQPWAEVVLPLLVQRWEDSDDPVLRHRDALVHWAVASGISKAELHRASGIARSTIDRVLESAPPAPGHP
ncbi:hypothetical protein [Streptomyces sp. CC224B]|uniref:hypothetical protein n=1 Tax=Streptomyces sp. CC224B TaxID=3044571 RepID=UPI0024A9668F|nr:hypothetical protein [Streptomyces sp. CC224B]